MGRCRTIGYLTATVVVVASLAMPAVAWARYRASGFETNTFATHVLLAPGRPACSGLAILSVTLSWTAPTDTAYVSSYELGESATSGGTYSYTNVGLVTSKTMSISSGNHFYVVRTVNHAWRGSLSPEREVDGLLTLAATCP